MSMFIEGLSLRDKGDGLKNIAVLDIFVISVGNMAMNNLSTVLVLVSSFVSSFFYSRLRVSVRVFGYHMIPTNPTQHPFQYPNR